MTQEITSAANPLIKRIRLLADRRHRRREGAFVVQGAQPVWQAVEAGADIETLVVAPDLLSATAAGLVEAQQQRGLPVALVSGALFRRLADRDGPAGLAAIVRARPAPLAGLAVPPGALFVALHEIASPGNLGTIIRTASAAGAAGVIVIGRAADPCDPAAVKASMGALFSVPVAHAPSSDEFFGWAGARGIGVTVTSPRGGTGLWDWRPARPGAILLGSEGAGLPAGLLERGDAHVRIPMTGTAESLNLAISAGVLLYEAWRVREDQGRTRDAGPGAKGRDA